MQKIMKIQTLYHFYGLHVYYMVKNMINLKLQGYNMCFLAYNIIFTLHIIHDKFEQLTPLLIYFISNEEI